MTNIAVRAPVWLGDAVESTAFIAALARKTRTRPTVVCAPGVAPVFEAHPDVSGVLLLRYSEGETVRQTARRIAAEKFDDLYVLPRSLRTALEAWLAGVPRRIGFGGDLKGWLFTDRVSYDARLPYAARYFRLIGESGPSSEALFFPKQEIPREKMEQVFAAPLDDLPRPLLGVAPISVAPSRTWDPENFAAAARMFHQESQGTVLLFGASNERVRIEEIRKAIGPSAVNVAGALTLPELGWAMSRLRAFLANDSGLMHVAAALRVPTLAIFGASDPAVAVPSGANITVVQRTDVPCVPCRRNRCVRFGRFHNECLRRISPEEVSKALTRILEREATDRRLSR